MTPLHKRVELRLKKIARQEHWAVDSTEFITDAASGMAVVRARFINDGKVKWLQSVIYDDLNLKSWSKDAVAQLREAFRL